MRLVVLHGLPGAGKLTVGRELARRTDYRLFHNHLTVDLAAAVFDFGTPEFVRLREDIWLDVFRRAARAGVAGLIFTFAWERTVPETFIGEAVRAVEEEGGEAVFVELSCAPDELRRRVEAPERARYGKLRSAELLDRLVDEGALGDLAAPPGVRALVVDVTKMVPEDAAVSILERLEA